VSAETARARRSEVNSRALEETPQDKNYQSLADAHSSMRIMAGAAAAAATATGGKVYVVTGATDGIGRLTATLLGRDGHTVAVHGRTPSKVQDVCREIDAAGGRAHPFVADLSRLLCGNQNLSLD